MLTHTEHNKLLKRAASMTAAERKAEFYRTQRRWISVSGTIDGIRLRAIMSFWGANCSKIRSKRLAA